MFILEFVDPITQEIMKHPVVTADGFSYEKRAIKLWLKDHNTSPMTNLPLAHKKLVPNINLKKQIEAFKERIVKDNEEQIVNNV